jgi:hypothetical protein
LLLLCLPKCINSIFECFSLEWQVLLKLAVHEADGGSGLPQNFISLAIYKVKDIWPRRARSQLLKFLCEDRLSDLNVRSRVLVLHALQQLKLSAHPR